MDILGPQILAMAGLGLALLAAAVLRFRKALDSVARPAHADELGSTSAVIAVSRSTGELTEIAA